MRNQPTRLNGTYTYIQEWKSATGASLCVYHKAAKPKSAAKGVVHINHGLAEHGGRYARFAQALSEAGYHVYAQDHRGHGATTAPDAGQGVFSNLKNNSGSDAVLDDAKFVNAKIKELHPNLPIIMFGHSMGAMITYNYILRWPETIDACALWNAAMSKGSALSLLKFVLGVESKFKNWSKPSIVNGLTFETFNKKFQPNKTSCDWLSRDLDECRKYEDDPDCGWRGSVSLWQDMLAWISYGASDQGLDAVPKNKPIFLLGGDADPSTDNAAATKDLQERFTTVGLMNVKTTVRPQGRHEALNEPKPERDAVTKEFIDWLATTA